jgi:hypothetical protein
MTNDAILSADALRDLAAVLDEIIPPSADGRLPGAGEAGVADHVVRALGALPDLRSAVVEGLADLDRAARLRHDRRFATLAPPERQALLAEQSFVFPLMLQTYVGYYQTPRGVEALGLEARPPHPQGYAMAPNDLSLLEPVRRRPRLYREC